MRPTVLSGLSFALLWITIKMIFFWSGAYLYNVVPTVLINMFLLLMAIAVGLYYQKRNEDERGNALQDIKNGLTAGVPYAVIVSVFIYFYYSSIDLGFNQHQISDAHMGIQKLLESPADLEGVRASNAEFEVMTKEEIFEKLKEGPEGFYKPSSTMTLSMLAMLLLATLNSIVITVIYRKIVFK